jgi:3-hydroxybutyryl-CoA dehydratase
VSELEFTLDELEVGHTFSPLFYPIDQGLIKDYVDTVGDQNPLHRDPSSAQAAGYRQIVAPPTIAALYVLKAYRTDAMPPPGGVQVRQRFKFYEPILAGDVLRVQAWVADKYVRRGRKYLVIDSVAQNQKGAEVVWSESTSFWND